jgi:tocopherol O-methyltransferase
MEKIKTDSPVLRNREEITRDIATFWNKTSEGFRMVWGPHIHHGYFEGRSETPVEAQEKLIEKLLDLLDISPQDKILDAGCGMGGSSLYLAKKYNATVTGVSLSQLQVDMATHSAEKEELKNVRFIVEDALSLASFSDNEFDLVWSLESCEQFYDKELFIQQAFRVLKPGGDLMLATWCSGSDVYDGLEAKKYQKLCAAFQLPYMPTINRYMQLLQRQGFAVTQALDWSSHVKESWDVGLADLKAHSLIKIFKNSGWRGMLFIKNARLMKYGFDEGRVGYGVFVARKPWPHIM